MKKGRQVVTTHTIEIWPRYAETDQGGLVHHSVYPVWMEMARTELLRANGLTYKELEEKGMLFVVAQLTVKYRRPCFYDKPVKITTTCTKVTAGRLEHNYQFRAAADNQLLAQANTVLACVNNDGKIRRMPEALYPA